MIKFPLIFVFSLCFCLTNISQNLKKDLPNHVWSWIESINDTSMVILSKQKSDKFVQVAEFDKTQLCLYKFNDTSNCLKFSYKIHHDILHLKHQTPDSTIEIYYRVAFNSSTQDYILKQLSTLKYIIPKNDTSSHDFLLLRKKNRTKEIDFRENLIIKIPSVIIVRPDGDSTFMTESIRGQFVKEKKDTLYIDETNYHVGIFSLGDTSKSSLWPINLSKILSIHKTRAKFNTFAGLGIFFSSISSLIISPLASIQKSGFNGERYYKFVGVSLASTAFFTTLRISFSHRKLKTWPPKHNWRIE